MLPQYKINVQEPLYTLSEAEKIVNYNRREKAREKHKDRVYYMIQKFCGLVLITVGFISLWLLDGDITCFIITVPMGIGLIITKEKVMCIGREMI